MAVLNGWITPEGQILECDYTGHISIAGDVVGALPEQERTERLIAADMMVHQVLFDMGYIRFFANPNCSAPVIEFEHYLLDIPKSQIMAQARLLKQI